ncbi:MAG: hypothetical protein FJZ64_03875 [Chlamydiae bacterium]|nr:hypothetical protein [Chlamydiota bacterium]
MSVITGVSNTNATPAEKSGTIYHHHTVELILPKPVQERSIRPETRMEKIRQVVADALILIGALMVLAATTAISLHTAGFASPIILAMETLLMPAIAAILTGFHLSKNEVKTNSSLRIPTGIPGLTIYS